MIPPIIKSSCDDHWEYSSLNGIYSSHFDHTAIWTGSEMIIWGGDLGADWGLTNSGLRYNPATDVWLPTSMGVNVPSARYFHSAVWTGGLIAADQPAAVWAEHRFLFDHGGYPLNGRFYVLRLFKNARMPGKRRMRAVFNSRL